MWINIVEEKNKIVSLHNADFLSKKNDQTFKNAKKVIHIEKWRNLSKNDLYTKLSTLSTVYIGGFLVYFGTTCKNGCFGKNYHNAI